MLKTRTKSAAKDRKVASAQDKLLPKLTIGFFKRPRMTALIWVVLVVFGAISYTTLLRKEGFPSVTIPIVVVNGVYAVNDSSEVDAKIGKPFGEIAKELDGVTTVTTNSDANFMRAAVQYEESVNAEQARKSLEKAIKDSGRLPESAQLVFSAPYFGITGGSIEKIDATFSLYDSNGKASSTELVAKADELVAKLNENKPGLVEDFFVLNPFEPVTNPVTGETSTVQRSFDRYLVKDGAEAKSYNSVLIGVTKKSSSDVIKLDAELETAVSKLKSEDVLKDFELVISGSAAPAIEETISELQRVLLEGLIAVLVVGSIVIALRASLITVIAMLTVIATTIGLLFVIGYTLNVITLFALILGLSLIVDDTIIMVEAIDAARKRAKTAKEAVHEATRKISRAMVAATLTASLSFAPLLFVGGVLGSFIRAIPVTIISSLLISLLVALVFIPLFSQFLLLGKKQLGEGHVTEVAAGFEARIARSMSRPMLWARGSTKRLFAVGLSAVLISVLFIGAGGAIFRNVAFNIFPPSKDTNQLSVTLSFPAGTTIQQAEKYAEQSDDVLSRTLGDNLVRSTYFDSGSTSGGSVTIDLISYGKRDVTAPQLVDVIEAAFKKQLPTVIADAGTLDAGPPAAGFTVQVSADSDRQASIKAAEAIRDFMETATLTRPNGETAKLIAPKVGDTSLVSRTNGRSVVTVTANFNATDTTTLVTLAQDAVKKEFSNTRLATFGLKASDVTFDIGQESENQDSFKTLALAFPAVLFVIFLLLAIQFRSLLQPLIIFMAIPFSFFGIALGLDITNNPFSFFAMLGFFALIGLSIKNTILLTDYANQARRAGMSAVDAAVEALGERFRPLVATSLTAIVSLIPLALTSPFWQGLAVVLIFGLASSTILVITVFPYYYLGTEYLRMHISRAKGLSWFVLTIALIFVLAKLGPVALVSPLLSAIIVRYGFRLAKRKA